jgi:hypothetical protein
MKIGTSPPSNISDPFFYSAFRIPQSAFSPLTALGTARVG